MYLNPTLNYELYKIASQNAFKPQLGDFIYMTKLAQAFQNVTPPTAPPPQQLPWSAPPAPVTPPKPVTEPTALLGR